MVSAGLTLVAITMVPYSMAKIASVLNKPQAADAQAGDDVSPFDI